MAHSLRIIASGALLGAVLAGATFGWSHTPFDPREVGAVIGALIGLGFAIGGLMHQSDPQSEYA